MARTTVIVSLLMLTVAGSARAQEHGPVGIVIAYPAAVGVVWHVSERVALRPDFSFSFNASDSTNTGSAPFAISSTSSAHGKSVSVGLSALFYVKKWDALRAYFSPRFGFIRATATTTTSTTFPLGGPTDLRNLNSTYTGSGSVGAQYTLGRRFSVFGEVGVSYSDLESSTGFATTIVETSGWSVSSRAGVGVVVYF